MKTQLYVSSLIVFLLAACGGSQQDLKTPLDAGIIGGKEVSSQSSIAKYVVLVYDKPTETYCTGTLIKPNIILTAAHCVGSNYESLSLAFGVNPLTGNYILRQAANAIANKDYQKEKSNQRNDVALILIKGTAPAGYQPLLLPDEQFPLQSSYTFTAAGYGRISGKKEKGDDPQGSGVLRQVDLQIDSFSTDDMQFYVNQQSAKGICNGDSGGPALMTYKGQNYVVGVASAISWTVPDEIKEDQRNQYIENKDFCSEKSIYMNVKKFRTWILENSEKLLKN